MFRLIITILLFCVAGSISAQERHDSSSSKIAEEELLSKGPDEILRSDSVVTNSDDMSLHLPTLTERGTMPQFGLPMTWYGGWMNYWKLHRGLNLSLGASVFSTFGSGNTWSGAGFGQNISLMYAMPLSKDNRWSLAFGGYFTNSSWAPEAMDLVFS